MLAVRRQILKYPSKASIHPKIVVSSHATFDPFMKSIHPFKSSTWQLMGFIHIPCDTIHPGLCGAIYFHLVMDITIYFMISPYKTSFLVCYRGIHPCNYWSFHPSIGENSIHRKRYGVHHVVSMNPTPLSIHAIYWTIHPFHPKIHPVHPSISSFRSITIHWSIHLTGPFRSIRPSFSAICDRVKGLTYNAVDPSTRPGIEPSIQPSIASIPSEGTLFRPSHPVHKIYSSIYRSYLVHLKN